MQSRQITVLSELGTAALAMCGFTASLGELERSAAATRAQPAGWRAEGRRRAAGAGAG